jgi:tetratricopeptide (TPR) repeat protein
MDSLTSIIQSNAADTTIVQAKINLVWYYRSRDNEKGIKLGKELIAEALNMSYKKGTGWAYNALGSVYLYGRNYPLAAENYIRALAIFEPLKDSIELTSLYNNLAQVYSDQLNFPLALSFFQKSLAIKRAIKDKAGMASTYNNIGVIYARQEQYNKADVMFKQSLKLEKELRRTRGTAESYQCLGNVACYQKKFIQASR